MNTLDTEWEKEELVRKAERDIEFVVSNPDMYDISVQVKNIVRNLLSSRDTYWKERVRKELEGMKRKKSKIGFEQEGTKMQQIKQRVFAQGYNQALDTLLDNLK